MAINIEISTVSRSAVLNLLPMGGLSAVHQRLKKKDVNCHYNTVLNTFKNPEDRNHRLTPKQTLVLKECVAYLQDLKNEAKLRIDENLAHELKPTGT